MNSKKIKLPFLFLIMLAVLCLTVLLSLTVGAAKIPLEEIVNCLFSGKDSSNRFIIIEIRLPRILLSVIVGAALSVVGAVMQGIFRNPLVDSYTLGMSSGASLGAVLSIIFGFKLSLPGFGTTDICAFLGAVLALVLVYILSAAGSGLSTTFLLLTGVVVSQFLSSFISLLMMMHNEKIEQIVVWTMGSFSYSTWNKVLATFPMVSVGIIIILFYTKELDILSLGEEEAFHLGVNVERVKTILLGISALMVGFSVSAAGTIGFVGLIVPHIMRLLVGHESRRLIPFSAVGGAWLLLVADTVGRTVAAPAEIPVGVVTSVLGCPFFLCLLKRKKMSET